MPKDKIDEELVQLIENMACRCGIPGCLAHEDEGGFIEFSAAEFELLKLSWEGDAASKDDSSLP
jgi:hypothetical protein